jgi:hypothetical protein
MRLRGRRQLWISWLVVLIVEKRVEEIFITRHDIESFLLKICGNPEFS